MAQSQKVASVCQNLRVAPFLLLFNVFYSFLSSKCSSFILSASNIKLPISRGASRRRGRSQEPRNALNPVSSLASGWPLLRCGFPIPELRMARPFPHGGRLMTSLAYWGSCHELEGQLRESYICVFYKYANGPLKANSTLSLPVLSGSTTFSSPFQVSFRTYAQIITLNRASWPTSLSTMLQSALS